MSNTDKTKEKLMESMRMTKAGSDKKNEEVNTKQEKEPQESKAIKKEKKPAAAKKVDKNNEKSSADPFQIVQRVWPD